MNEEKITEETKRMGSGFGFFGPAAFAYAVFYAFCMFHNGSGVTYPFFIAGGLLFLYCSLGRLGASLKKGSGFYIVSILLLAVSTFCTDDARIIILNKIGIFLLMMSLLLKQFFDTSKWDLGKYLLSICQLVFGCIGELGKPVADMAAHFKSRFNQNEEENGKKLWYAFLGVVITIPVFLIVLLLLSSADAVFRELTGYVFENISFKNIFNVIFRIVLMYFMSYALISYLCRRAIKADVEDRKTGEPILAITVTGMLTLLYVVFSGIQIVYLFLGKMQLPAGYTYAEYAREGFFQLLAVSILNLILVLLSMSFFKESKALKTILTLMSFCTFIMIASSAMRMIIYIQYCYLTFLRIMVLWTLAVLFFLFAGVVISIVKKGFPLFTYSAAVVTALYLALSFMHPDYVIATVNLANAEGSEAQNGFFKSSEPYHDYSYLYNLSADAAPVLISYLKEAGYNIGEDKVGCYYLGALQKKTDAMSARTFNLSRYLAKRALEQAGG